MRLANGQGQPRSRLGSSGNKLKKWTYRAEAWTRQHRLPCLLFFALVTALLRNARTSIPDDTRNGERTIAPHRRPPRQASVIKICDPEMVKGQPSSRLGSSGDKLKKWTYRAEAWAKRQRLFSILFAGFITFALLAFFVLPMRQPVYRPGPLGVTVDTPLPEAGLSTTLKVRSTDTPSHEYAVEVWVEWQRLPFITDSSDTLRADMDAGVGVTIQWNDPGIVASPACRLPDKCSIGRELPSWDPASKNLRFRLNWKASSQNAGTEAHASFKLTSPTGFGFFTNGLNLAGQLPYFAITNNGHPTHGAMGVEVQYWAPGVNEFAWPKGIQEVNADYVDWIYESSRTATEEFSLTNPAVSRSDSLRTFIAGALVGISGGALVGSLQEAARPSTPPARRIRRHGGRRPAKGPPA